MHQFTYQQIIQLTACPKCRSGLGQYCVEPDSPEVECCPERKALASNVHDRRIADAKLLLKSNGYDVTKQANPGNDYVNGLLEFAHGFGRPAWRIDTNATITNLMQIASQHDPNGEPEIFIELDRAMLLDEIKKAVDARDVEEVVGGTLWTHLWPVVMRIDEDGDVVLHVTDGERAQFGEDES